MSNVIEADTAAVAAAKDRRRPGRLAVVNAELIPLLRGEAPIVADPPMQFDEPDQLRGARGIVLGLVVSAALWTGLAYVSLGLF